MFDGMSIYETNAIITGEIAKLFIKKQIDQTDPKVLAAIITAVSKMSKVDGRVDEFTAMDELVDFYNISNNQKVAKYIEKMTPELVNSIIGYNVNFDDITEMSDIYENDKVDYSYLYLAIGIRQYLRNENRQIS